LVDRVTGSLAFGALSRVVWVAAQKQDDDEGRPGARVLMLAKSNIGPDKGGFEYELQNLPLYSNPDIIASIAAWGDRVEGSARDILAEAETVKAKDESKATALREAKDFLFDLLIDGPIPAKEIVAAAREAKQSWRTVERAKSELKIWTGSRRDGYPWSLPQDEPRHEKNELYLKTLADLADIKKAKKNKGVGGCKFGDWRSRTNSSFARRESAGPDMSVHQVLKAASNAGITLRVDGPDLVVESDNDVPEALLDELRRCKPQLIATLTDALPPRFSDLYETEQDYARALLRYAEQDRLSLTTKDGRLVIAVSSKSDADLLSEIRAHDGAVIEALAGEPSQGFRSLS
jgi:hypothetical protein